MYLKDVAVAYVSGAALFLLLLSVNTPGIFPLFVFIVPYAVPLAYIFWKDRFDLTEAALISGVFGVTLLPVLLLLVWVSSSFMMIAGALQPSGTAESGQLSGLLPVLLFNVAVSTIIGLAVWFITHRVKKA